MYRPYREFYSYEEAVDAVCMDLRGYAPQPQLMSRVAQFFAGTQDIVRRIRAGEPEGLREARDALCERITITAIAPEQLIEICSQVFETHTAAAVSSHGEEGIWVYLGMEKFVCQHCGQCCLLLDIHDQCRPEDIALWERMGRYDILEWTGRQGRGDPGHLWINPGTGLFAEICPWLIQKKHERSICAIHSVKPQVCREYPGTRKHARMTGCKGL